MRAAHSVVDTDNKGLLCVWVSECSCITHVWETWIFLWRNNAFLLGKKKITLSTKICLRLQLESEYRWHVCAVVCECARWWGGLFVLGIRLLYFLKIKFPFSKAKKEGNERKMKCLIKPSFFLMTSWGQLLWFSKDIRLHKSLWENNPWPVTSAEYLGLTSNSHVTVLCPSLSPSDPSHAHDKSKKFQKCDLTV